MKSEVERIWDSGKTVIFDVDVKGGISLKKYFGDQALSVFIMPPSVAELELRLIARGTDDLETIQTRVQKASQEIAFKDEFDEIVVNNELDHAKITIKTMVENFLKS